MRYLLTLLCASACFSEGTSTPSDCPTGTPGCDCRVDDACDEGLECVISIDKCVPIDCTPGTHTCTCDVNSCNSALVCEGGVCLDPTPDTTGGVTIASTSPSTTDASTTTVDPSTTASTTSTTTADTSTNPGTITDTGETSVSTTAPTSGSTGASTSTAESSSSEGPPIPCPQCLEDAAVGACVGEYDSCLVQSIDFGCNQLQECVINGLNTPDSCCIDNTAKGAHALWENFVTCAMANECGDSCAPLCLN